MGESSSLPVFSVGELPADGQRFTLDGPEGRHAATVRRLHPGDRLLLADGRGGTARCEVTGTGRDLVELAVSETWRVPQPRLRVLLAQALVKGDRGELAVELATEAGVDRVLPWRASRCVARWDDGPRGTKQLGRWRTTAEQAAKQARRSWTPDVGDPVRTRDLVEVVRAAPAAFVLHEAAEEPLAAAPLPAEGEIVLVVGPEGGVSPDELAELTAAGARPVRLGPTVLRASTAGAVALGALGALTERWSG